MTIDPGIRRRDVSGNHVLWYRFFAGGVGRARTEDSATDQDKEADAADAYRGSEPVVDRTGIRLFYSDFARLVQRRRGLPEQMQREIRVPMQSMECER